MSPEPRRQGPTRVSPFAWWSVGLGAVSLLPCLWIYFVPAISAIICGVLTRRQLSTWPDAYHGAGLARTGILLAVASMLLGILVLTLLFTGVWESPATS